MHPLTKEYLQGCSSCLQFKINNQLPIGSLQSIPVGDPAVHWRLDVFGPCDVSKKRNRYILIAVYYGSRFCVAKAVRDATAQQFIKFLEEQLIW